MSHRTECLRLMREHRADVQDLSRPGVIDLNLWSPVGFMWAATDCHSLTVRDTVVLRGWRSLAEDLRSGLVPCDNAECETCEEETK